MDGPQRHDGRQNLVGHLLLSKFWIWGEFCSRKLSDILFYVRDISQSTRTISISEHNLIKWCQWEHLLDRILKGLRVRGAGLKLFMGSIDDLVCQLCIGCSLSLSNNGTKLAVVSDSIVLTYSFWLVLIIWTKDPSQKPLCLDTLRKKVHLPRSHLSWGSTTPYQATESEKSKYQVLQDMSWWD